jgi:hypothetical protein
MPTRPLLRANGTSESDSVPVGARVMGLSDSNSGSDISWGKVLAAVAGAAGGAAWVSAVGSGVVALRLRQADLPIEPVVALMTAEHRFAIGAGILILPLLAAFFGFLIDWLVVRPKEHRQTEGSDQEQQGCQRDRQEQEERRHRQRLLWAVGTLLLGVVVVYFVLRPPLETIAFAGGAVVLVVPAVLEVLHRAGVETRGFYEQLAVFLSVLVAAGAGAIFAEAFGSPSFDETEITIRDQQAPITGGYITSTEHSVVLTPRCEVVEAVPRDRIERISVGPGEVRPSHC